jgi:hypothetical protein
LSRSEIRRALEDIHAFVTGVMVVVHGFCTPRLYH